MHPHVVSEDVGLFILQLLDEVVEVTVLMPLFFSQPASDPHLSATPYLSYSSSLDLPPEGQGELDGSLMLDLGFVLEHNCQKCIFFHVTIYENWSDRQWSHAFYTFSPDFTV